MEPEPPIEIRAEGVDTEQIVEQVRRTVERKAAQGAYADPRVARAERTNLASLDSDEFLSYYMQCLHDAVYVDINDFEIAERRRCCSGLLVAVKKAVWKALKFYTYRLWSQQNEVNGLLLSVTETMDAKYRERIRDLEARVKKLEK